MLRSRAPRRASHEPLPDEWLPVPRRLSSLRRWMLVLIVASVVLLVGQVLYLQVATHSKEKWALTLAELANRHVAEPRGIIMPLFDDIAVLGISMILELRAMQIDLPIEVPHCGDLNETIGERLANDKSMNVRVYDVCLAASLETETDALGIRWPLFCKNLEKCHKIFRTWDIKALALVYSRFEEVMMVDADVMFFQNPMSLWELDKYKKTGTLFFPDRLSFTDEFLGQRAVVYSWGFPVELEHRTRLHEFIEIFDRKAFAKIDGGPQRNEKTTDPATYDDQRSSFKHSDAPGDKRYKPSQFLIRTHAWSQRSGHQADSSVMLWSKTKQPRATAMIGAFISVRRTYKIPSYGDKEYYFLACELAGSQYAFSDFAVGSIGSVYLEKDRALCGDGLHFYPIKGAHIASDDDIQPLYINSDHIATWDIDKEVYYRSNARSAEYYPGSFIERNLGQECPFDLKAIPLTEQEKEAFRRRQRLIKTAHSWLEKKPENPQPLTEK